MEGADGVDTAVHADGPRPLEEVGIDIDPVDVAIGACARRHRGGEIAGTTPEVQADVARLDAQWCEQRGDDRLGHAEQRVVVREAFRLHGDPMVPVVRIRRPSGQGRHVASAVLG